MYYLYFWEFEVQNETHGTNVSQGLLGKHPHENSIRKSVIYIVLHLESDGTPSLLTRSLGSLFAFSNYLLLSVILDSGFSFVDCP